MSGVAGAVAGVAGASQHLIHVLALPEESQMNRDGCSRFATKKRRFPFFFGLHFSLLCAALTGYAAATSCGTAGSLRPLFRLIIFGLKPPLVGCRCRGVSFACAV